MTIPIHESPTGDVEEQLPEEPLFIDKKEDSEAAFWRLKRAADTWRENRIKGVLAQEGESLRLTFGRALYLCGCILFDGLILTEVIFLGERSAVSWALFGALLGFAIIFQKEIYDKLFAVDISQIDFDQQ